MVWYVIIWWMTIAYWLVGYFKLCLKNYVNHSVVLIDGMYHIWLRCISNHQQFLVSKRKIGQMSQIWWMDKQQTNKVCFCFYIVLKCLVLGLFCDHHQMTRLHATKPHTIFDGLGKFDECIANLYFFVIIFTIRLDSNTAMPSLTLSGLWSRYQYRSYQVAIAHHQAIVVSAWCENSSFSWLKSVTPRSVNGNDWHLCAVRLLHSVLVEYYKLLSEPA